ncbi:hypothetical protein J0X14_06790 [Muricauda sp. CAU 1633]|uniref:hypothetical protein n=1 Tax=Allomuricauda sp. CAU 1633 TaxID=2816036 RepID=UPI001A8F318D|nr:hypothetical protein [Muricauda sp. CAU 1633]MBO0321996.1 hypothetical protein [Muricauda sp. CAU 1633]
MRAALFCLFLMLNFTAFAQQECLLGVGGEDDETIAKVFQLNEEQQENLKNWSAELKIRNEILQNRADYLLKQHKESSVDVLLTVSKEYQDILDSMKQNVRMIDKRLLSTLNPKQYEFYTELCSKLTLRPIYINRSVDEK